MALTTEQIRTANLREAIVERLAALGVSTRRDARYRPSVRPSTDATALSARQTNHHSSSWSGRSNCCQSLDRHHRDVWQLTVHRPSFGHCGPPPSHIFVKRN